MRLNSIIITAKKIESKLKATTKKMNPTKLTDGKLQPRIGPGFLRSDDNISQGR